MALPDHYEVLGVGRDASLATIRKAFRRHARRCHPDLVGVAGSERFQEISVAHQVLSNPERRRAYDEVLNRLVLSVVRTRTTVVNAPVSESSDRSVVEASQGAARPSPEGGRPHGDGSVEIRLSAKQAHQGGRFPFVFSIVSPCAHRNHVGRRSSCPQCEGTGQRAVRLPAEVEIPGGVESGTRLRAEIQTPLLRKATVVYLTVIVDVPAVPSQENDVPDDESSSPQGPGNAGSPE